MSEDTNEHLKKLLQQNHPDDVIRSLQVHLGYGPGTHLPTIDEFVENDYYLGKVTDNGKGIYPYWRQALREIFPNPLYINYDTLFFRSAIGTGKSSVARIVILYIMQKVINMENPHKFYGLLPNKELVVFLYALQKSTISGAMYNPLVEIIDSSQFFRSNLDTSKKGYHFKNKVVIKTGSTVARNVGLDIFLVWMDEIQQERLRGGNLENYNSLKARIKSRFMLSGGIYFNSICVLSGSPGSANDFSERLTNKNEDNENAKIYNTAQWEVLCAKIKYSGKTFKVFVGDDSNEPKILDDPLEIKLYESLIGDNDHLIINVPEEYRRDFEDDLLIAIRDIAGSVTRSSHLFMTNLSKLDKAFSLKSKFFNIDVIKLPFFDNTQIKDFLVEPDQKVLPRLFNPNNYRFIHIDIGVVSDLTGISMTHIADFVDTSTYSAAQGKWIRSKEPWYINDFNVGIGRIRGEETSIKKLVQFIIYLRDSGVNIHTVTTDGYQSTQLRQELVSAGINCEIMSVMKSSAAYDTFKRACYEDRIQLPKNKMTQTEFKQLRKEIKGQKVKVVHPSTAESGSHGDICEAVCASVHSAYLKYKSGVDPLRGISMEIFRLRQQNELTDINEENIYNILSAF